MTPEAFAEQAKDRVQRAGRGHKQIALGRNYERLHAALRRFAQPKPCASDELDPIDRDAMAAVERGVA